MDDYQLYEVLIPISGAMRIHLRAQNKNEAAMKSFEIAEEMKKNSTDTIIPNLSSWEIDMYNATIVIEKGEADE